jgi:rhodanese-related sulfurtransferase
MDFYPAPIDPIIAAVRPNQPLFFQQSRNADRINRLIKEVKPLEAHDLLSRDPRAVLLDVRSRMEFHYVGHPVGAVNIPWKEPPEWKIDVNFADKVRAALADLYPDAERVEDLTILALCRSGQRSRAAGEALLAQGFTRVYNVAEGFEGDRDQNRHRNTLNGWRVHQLPWEQS